MFLQVKARIDVLETSLQPSGRALDSWKVFGAVQSSIFINESTGP